MQQQQQQQHELHPAACALLLSKLLAHATHSLTHFFDHANFLTQLTLVGHKDFKTSWVREETDG